MRRDICCIFDRPLPDVFNAYIQAAKNIFNKDAHAEYYHTITIGLNFSFRYNMNGGTCTIHFLSRENGTAVNVRYTIVQLLGARYESHYKDLLREVEKILNINSTPADIDIDFFTKSEAKVYSLNGPRLSNSVTENVSNIYNPPETRQNIDKTFKFCTQCGTKLEIDSRFCSNCGKQQK